MCACPNVVFFRGFRERGFNSTSEPYQAVENYEKRVLHTLFENTLRYKVINQKLKFLFWHLDIVVVFALPWKPKKETFIMHDLVGKENKLICHRLQNALGL